MQKETNLEKAINYENRSRLPGFMWQELRDSVFRRDEYRCVKCKDTATECDHVVAVALGGNDDENNLQSLCDNCHKEKTKQDIAKIQRVRRFRKAKTRTVGNF